MNRRSNSWLPPPWAILAMMVLGFNEAMALLRCPLFPPLVFFLSPLFWYLEGDFCPLFPFKFTILSSVFFVRNPLLLVAVVVIYFMLRALWVQMDLENDFQSGLVLYFIVLSLRRL